MKYIYTTFALLIFLSACTTTPKKEFVADLKSVDQNISAYVTDVDGDFIGNEQSYLNSYFKPWEDKQITLSLKSAMWAYRAFNEHNSYGENLLPRKKAFFTKMLQRSNFKEFATINQPAITLKVLNIRAYPTNKPLLLDPKRAGEGFPFDYLQNSTIAPNKPIMISHYSQDREWAFIEASFAYGWVKTADIALISKDNIKKYEETSPAFLLKESLPLYDENGNFLFRSRIGMLLPFVSENNETVTLLSVKKGLNNEALFTQSTLSLEFVHKHILKFNAKNIITVFNEVSNVKYGWGGIYGDRDCSSTLRDFFAPFGIWLPRNSYAQSRVGKIISLKGLNDEQKLIKIKREAIPLETLLYKPGHILLYMGVKNGKVIVFHNTWGIKTKKNAKAGRFLIGRPIFSTLEVGSNLRYYDSDASLLSHLQSMNILNRLE